MPVMTPAGYRAAAIDDRLLRSIFADARSAEFDLIPDQLRSQVIDLQYAAQGRQYRSSYPNADDRFILSDGTPVGRLLVDTGIDEFVLVDIAILRDHRARGLGSVALAHLCEKADAAQSPIRLRVLATEPRLAGWYARYGFSQAGASGSHLTLVRQPRAEGLLS